MKMIHAKKSNVKRFAIIANISTFFALIFTPGRALAAPCDPGNGALFLPTWYKYVEGVTVDGRCAVDAQFPQDLGKILLAIVEILLRVGGFIAVGYVVYGGFRYITSQGEPEGTKSARQTIVNALVGLIISTIATVSVTFIGRQFTQ